MKLTLSLSALLLVAAVALQGFAQESEKSRDQLIAEALRAYNEGNYDKALDLYFEAKVIEDLAEIDYSIARCYHNLQKCEQARKFYEKTMSRIDELPEGFDLRVQKQLVELESCVDPEDTVVVTQPEPPPVDPQPVDPEPELPEESSIDWLSIGIMGGGAAIAIAGLGVDLGSQGLIDDHKKYSSDISTGSNDERRTKVAG
ncbi:MAG: tetratricopeptide repeat protein, partial [Myxococcota bacterium]|nr:tetratricopeptide repeat protein [Myxococcota bacterium]